jgi:diacylglycerol kinase (ATP)
MKTRTSNKESCSGKWSVIVNPKANCGKGDIAIMPFLAELRASEIEFVGERTTHPGHATELAQRAVKEGCIGIVACGGDGTLNEVANGLIGSGVPMLPIPIGRGNDFVKSVACGRTPKKQVGAIVSGRTILVDTIKISGVGYAINGISVDDFPTTVSLQVESGLFAYIKPALRNLPTYQDKLYRISFDGKTTIEGRFLVFVIMNGSVAGKDFRFCPEAKVDDGLLDTCLVRQVRGKLSRLCYLVAVIWNGRHARLSATEMKKTSNIYVAMPQSSSIDLQVDGEHKKTKTNTLNISVEPKSLLIQTP